VKKVVNGLEARGFKSPYLRNYVVARINPVRFERVKPGERVEDAGRGGAD
jgi:ParB family chromosome partitioning protein